MRPALLGTTALIATSLLGARPAGADGLRLGLGRHYQAPAPWTIGQSQNVDPPGGGSGNPEFKQDVEIRFQGETQLDNGLTIGARIVLLGQSARSRETEEEADGAAAGSSNEGDQIDEVFAYVQGGFGEMRFGDTEEIRYQQTPALSTIRAPRFEMGERMASLLVSRIAAPSQRSRHVVVPTELVLRGSCAAPRD